MILLISAVFPPEPVVSASLTSDLASALSESVEVKVLTPRPSRPLGFVFKAEEYRYKEFEHIVVNSFIYPESKIIGRLYESFSFGTYAARYIKKNRTRIDCIYLNSWPLFAQYLIIRISKKYSIPVILHVQDIYPESLLDKLPIFKKLLINLLLPFDWYVQKNAFKVVTISPRMKSFLINSRGLKFNIPEVVYNWQNEEKFIAYKNSIKQDFRYSVFTFMFLGNLNRTAAIDVLISAYEMSRIENSRLVIAGTGSEKDHLKSLANRYKGINIEFWDAPLTKVPEIQDKSDVLLLNLKKGAARFALPSKLSGYMFSGKPIIACVEEDTDVASIIESADCGWVTQPENVNKLASTMKVVKGLTREELQKKGKNGYNYAIKHLTKEINLKRLANIIEKASLISV